MSRSTEGGRAEGKQNALIHEGVPSDGASDTNERADDTADVRQPDGEQPVPRDDD
jgi:hypothetical protein